MARPEGLEPSTYRLTAGRSTIELRANKSLLHIYYSKSKRICKQIFKIAVRTPVIILRRPVFVGPLHNKEGYDCIHLLSSGRLPFLTYT